MNQMAITKLVSVACLLTASTACAQGTETPKNTRVVKESTGTTVAVAMLPGILKEPVPVDKAIEDKAFAEAAQAAWAFVNKHYEPKTGLVHAQPDWAFPTLWDIGSSMGATYAARELGYISDAEFSDRTRRVLATLKTATLYDNVSFGRNYDAKTGSLVDDAGKPTMKGTGYSALDLGRLLIWLRIVANVDPSLTADAQAIVNRINVKRVIQKGYLHAEQILQPGKPASKYQEGRLGYEQYAAEGLALWGLQAREALRFNLHRKPATAMGIKVSADNRGLDRLTSEPFILHGMELGMSPEMQEVAMETLGAQAQRFLKTDKMTIASEDAIKLAPHYFYYYCVLCSGKEFVINVHSPGITLDEPRWVSTKASFAWHAIMPSKYTWQAVEYVRPALDAKSGWATGVFEKDHKSTETYTLNTAGVILEAAAYRKRGRPFIRQ